MRGKWEAGCKARLNGAVAAIRPTSLTWVTVIQTTHLSVDGGPGLGEIGRLGGQVPRGDEAGPVGSHRVLIHRNRL
jgi:hypothetical protein